MKDCTAKIAYYKNYNTQKITNQKIEENIARILTLVAQLIVAAFLFAVIIYTLPF